MKQNKMNYKKETVGVDQLEQHKYHQKVYGNVSSTYLDESIKRTGNSPINKIVVVPNNTTETHIVYYVISGMSRLESQKRLGEKEVDIMIYNITDETEIKNLIIDLNKFRKKNGKTKLMEFRHWLKMYPDKRGEKGYNRYSSIGKEINMDERQVSTLNTLVTFFDGNGEVVLESLFDGVLNTHQVSKLKKVVENHPEKFNSEDIYKKLCDPTYDFGRLGDYIQHINFEDKSELEVLGSYLSKNIDDKQLEKSFKSMNKMVAREKKHKDNKVDIPEIDENYISTHTYMILGDNRDVELVNPFGKPIQTIVGSPPYGNIRLNGEDPAEETGHGMTGKEYGKYLSETYERYKEHLAPDGSIYIIMDDYRNEFGSHSCSLAYFVVEMVEKGFHLSGWYNWCKSNPQPRGYSYKPMVNSFEMIYRFTLDPKGYYNNPDLFHELEEKERGFNASCTNTDNKGNTTRGGSYFQGHLKKLRNIFNEETCQDIIRCNVSQPEDFFRQEKEKRHTSTCPIELTSVLVLESTRPGDVIMDIWNGVGNSMVSSLLLGREYIGIEKEKNYFDQTRRRIQMTEPGLLGV
ncbi:DNA methyltransferase [Bacteroidota bacterium]